MNAFVTASLGLALLGGSAAAQERGPEFPAEQIKKGADLFARNCATCHGARMRNPQWAIDLRTFPRDAHARFVDAVAYGKRNDRLAIRCGEEVWQHEKRVTGFSRNLLHHVFQLMRVVNRGSKRLY